MENIQATALKSMPFARVDQDTGTIVFRFEGQDDSEHTFACAPEAIPEIVARLVAAGEESAKVTGKPTQAIVVPKSEISIDEDRGHVGLALYPTSKTGILFNLEPKHAQKISSDLAVAAAKVHPQKPDKQN